MPELVVCPECKAKLNIPERLLGKKVKCTHCKAIFTAPDEPGGAIRAARRGEEDDRPRRARGEDDEDDLPQTDPAEQQLWFARLATLLFFINLCVTLGTMAVLFFTDVIVIATITSFSKTTSDILWWMRVLLVAVPGLCATLTGDVGLVLAIFGPRRRAAMGLAIAAAAVSGLHLMLLLIGLAIAQSQSSRFGFGFDQTYTAHLATTFFSFHALAIIDHHFDFVAFLAALTEVARFILFALWGRAALANYKRRDMLAFATMFVMGGMAFLLLLAGVVGRLLAPTSFSPGDFRLYLIAELIPRDLVLLGVYAFLLFASFRYWRQLKQAKPR